MSINRSAARFLTGCSENAVARCAESGVDGADVSRFSDGQGCREQPGPPRDHSTVKGSTSPSVVRSKVVMARTRPCPPAPGSVVHCKWFGSRLLMAIMPIPRTVRVRGGPTAKRIVRVGGQHGVGVADQANEVTGEVGWARAVSAPLASKTVRLPPAGGATLSGEASEPFPVSALSGATDVLRN